MLSSSDIGKAGELRVASELILRGHRPMLSLVDEGVDITLENSKTLQVKSCHVVNKRQGKTSYYVFTFHTLHEKRDENGRRRKKQKMIADFAVLWCIEVDLFFVIPQKAIGGLHTVNIPDNNESSSKWNEYHDKWEVLD